MRQVLLLLILIYVIILVKMLIRILLLYACRNYTKYSNETNIKSRSRLISTIMFVRNALICDFSEPAAVLRKF